MKPVLSDDRLDPGQFGDLMDHGFGIVTGEPLATAPAGGRPAVERLVDPLGWHQDAPGLAMSGLAAALLPAGRGRGLPLHPDRIGRGGLGRVGGVELEPGFEVTDPRLQFINLLPHRQECGGDGRLGVRRHLGPEFLGDGRWVDHDEGIVASSATFNPGL
jgi:hypothetical protein